MNVSPRHLKTSAILLLSLMVSACGKPATGPADYTLLSGETGRFESLQGRWFVINYWATWCKPCIKEIPELNEFAKAHQDKVTVFAVNYDQLAGEELTTAVEEFNLEIPAMINDPASVLGYETPTVLPTTLIFNSEGKLHKTLIGPQTGETLLSAMGLGVNNG